MIFNNDKKLVEVHDSLGQKFDQKFTDFQAHVSGLVATMDARFGAIESKLHSLSIQRSADYDAVAQQLALIHKTREDVEKSTRSFTDVQRKIERVVDEQIGGAIRASVDHLKLDVGKYDLAKKEIENSAKLLAQMNEEFAKFHAISKEIKQGDFQLVKYAKELQASDSERVKLMKEIDDLQRMVAKMRRGPEQRKSQMKF